MARKSKGKAIRNICYVFCEGKTECQYFGMLNKKYRNTKNVQVKPIDLHGKTVKQMFKEADKTIKSLPKEDQQGAKCYFVFDKDNHSPSLITEAIQECKKRKDKYGFSNISFEFWLLLHFEEPNKVYNEQNLKALYTDLEKKLGITCYCNKKGKLPMDKLEDLVQNAMNRGGKYSSRNYLQGNYTNVGELLKEIYKRDNY